MMMIIIMIIIIIFIIIIIIIIIHVYDLFVYVGLFCVTCGWIPRIIFLSAHLPSYKRMDSRVGCWLVANGFR